MNTIFGLDYLVVTGKNRADIFQRDDLGAIVFFQSETFPYTYKSQSYGTRFYREVYEVWLGKTKIAQLFTHPVMSHMAGLSQIQFVNNVFYSSDFYSIIKDLLDFHFESYHISRIDLYTDIPQEFRHEETLQSWQGNFHKSSVKKYWSDYDADKVSGWVIGSRETACCMRVYDKAAECTKDYIRDLHARTFGQSKLVWRVEFEIHRQYFNHNNLGQFMQGFPSFDELHELFQHLAKNKTWQKDIQTGDYSNFWKILLENGYDNTKFHKNIIEKKKLNPEKYIINIVKNIIALKKLVKYSEFDILNFVMRQLVKIGVKVEDKIAVYLKNQIYQCIPVSERRIVKGRLYGCPI